ncbi:MAG: hypothetical protein ACOY93_03255 [Bacillota bacterium]
MRRRALLLLIAAAGLIGGYLLYWYLQSPVPAGVYPARLGGHIGVHEEEPVFDLPVIWVRPHPFAAHPPEFSRIALVGEEGDGPLVSGNWRPKIQWLDEWKRPVWLRSRAVQGSVRVRFPEEGFTAIGVRWQITGEPERLYRTGPVRFLWSPSQESTLRNSGGSLQLGYPHDEPGKPFDRETIEGYYLFLQGHGRIVEIISSLAGAESPPTGLRYRTGQEDWGTTRRFYEKEVYEPVTLPWEFAGSGTLYVPLPSAVNERARDTYFFHRPILVVEEAGSRRVLVTGYTEYGLRTNRCGWRYWVPYFIYTPGE